MENPDGNPDSSTVHRRAGANDKPPTEAALESLVDPVVVVTEDVIEYANAAAREAFGLDSAADRLSPAALDAHFDWDRVRDAIVETTIGTARQVRLDDSRYDARVHRGEDVATITFEPEPGLAESETASDRAVKARAVRETPVGVAISDPHRPDNPLVYVNEAFREITGYDYEEVVGQNCRFLQGPNSDPDAVSALREGIEAERPVTVELENYRKDGTQFWNEVTVAPVYDDRGKLTNYVGFQNDVTTRKEAELEAARRTEELESLLERVEGLVQDVTEAVVGATSRSELEATVCERIAAEPSYDGAWIGERNPVTGAVDARTSAGTTPWADSLTSDTERSDSVDMKRTGEGNPREIDRHPALETLDTGTVSTVLVDTKTTVAIPLRYEDIQYGVLVVRANTDRQIDDHETVVLSALARVVASGVNARETSRVLETDAVVAVDLELTDRDIAPVAISADAGCRLEYRQSVHRTDDETASLFTIEGATADEVHTVADDLDGVDVRTIVDREDGCLVEVASDHDVVSWLSKRGVRTRSIDARTGRARITIDVPRPTNVRSVVDAVKERHPETVVAAFKQRDRSETTRVEFAARLEDDLTDRQFTALQRAYLGGYFEWPRPTTGEELAESMGVTRPTFHEHLRSAEEKLARAFFDDSPPTAP